MGSSIKLPVTGYRKLRLIRELAVGDKTQVELAEKYGVTQGAISQFMSRHADEVVEARKEIASHFTGVWVADKVNRVMEYQQDVEDLNEAIGEVKGAEGRDPVTDLPPLMRVKHGALKSVSEELGQLPARVNVQLAQTTINYTVDGVDMDSLR